MKVGIIADVNNPLVPGLFQNSVNAVEAWAKDVNASGGLAGRQVTVDFCDSRLDPNATANCVIKACQNDFALVGTSANALEDLSGHRRVQERRRASRSASPTLPPSPSRPESCDPDTYLTSGLGTYCATAKDNPQTYTVPVGDARYFTAHNPGLHGIWLYDSDDPTFKITETPVFKAESNLGIKTGRPGLLRAERRGAAERADPVHPADQVLGFHVRL